jgi:hypothetical protein
LLLAVKAMVVKYGIERVGFLTLTFADQVTDIREAQRRYNSLANHVLRHRYQETIAIVERMKSGRLHFHLLVAMWADIRAGVDFDAVKRGDYRSANSALRAEWAFWRRTAKRYGFGRTELMPIRTCEEAVGRYMGWYLTKHMGARKQEDKGAHLVRYSGARVATTRIAGVGPRSWLWRKKTANFARRMGFTDEDTFTEWARATYGCHWQYRLMDVIASEPIAVYPTLKHVEADGMAVWLSADVDPKGTDFKFGEEPELRSSPVDGWDMREQLARVARRMEYGSNE